MSNVILKYEWDENVGCSVGEVLEVLSASEECVVDILGEIRSKGWGVKDGFGYFDWEFIKEIDKSFELVRYLKGDWRLN